MKKYFLLLMFIIASVGAEAQEGVMSNTLSEGWFVEVGVDMTLQCPYGKDFSQVFPKGDSFGLDAGIGKWFSPYIALRAHLNWENGLIKNSRLEWLAPNEERTKSNYDCGGYIVASIDVPVSVTNIVAGVDADRPWDAYVFARAGLGYNFSISSTSPIVGGGFGGSYALNPKVSLFGEFALQATTSDFYHGVAGTGMDVSTGFNCSLGLQAGVRVSLSLSRGKK